MTDQLDHDLAVLDEAEARLDERARARRQARARRERRSALRRRWLGIPVRVAGLALAGSAALVGLLSASGGDLSAWPGPLALLALALVFAAPAALAARMARRKGTAMAAAAALGALGMQLALTFLVAFLLLGLGPS